MTKDGGKNMGFLQVAVADCDPGIRRSLQTTLQRDGQLRFVGGAGDGAEAYRLIREKQPDVAIIDMVMPKIDGFTLIEQIKRDRTIRKMPQFILTTPAHNEQIMAAAFQMGVSYFLLKPYDPQMLANRVKQLTGMGNGYDFIAPMPEEMADVRDADREADIRELLHQLGIPAHLRGYRYMVTAVQAAISDDEMLEGITKLLYPHVAKVHGSTPSRVERALRHAIEVAWERGCAQAQEKLFGSSVSFKKGKPTNSEFIATVSGCIRCR